MIPTQDATTPRMSAGGATTAARARAWIAGRFRKLCATLSNSSRKATSTTPSRSARNCSTPAWTAPMSTTSFAVSTRRPIARPRRPAGRSGPRARNIPRRGGRGRPASPGGSGSRNAAPPPPPAASPPSALPDAALQPALMEPLGFTPGAEADLGDEIIAPNFATGLGGGNMSGMGGMGNAGAYYSSAMPPVTPGDQLAQLIHNLGTTMSGMRSGRCALPETQRAQVAEAEPH